VGKKGRRADQARDSTVFPTLSAGTFTCALGEGGRGPAGEGELQTELPGAKKDEEAGREGLDKTHRRRFEHGNEWASVGKRGGGGRRKGKALGEKSPMCISALLLNHPSCVCDMPSKQKIKRTACLPARLVQVKEEAKPSTAESLWTSAD